MYTPFTDNKTATAMKQALINLAIMTTPIWLMAAAIFVEWVMTNKEHNGG